jgi:hypothetical protein
MDCFWLDTWPIAAFVRVVFFRASAAAEHLEIDESTHDSLAST